MKADLVFAAGAVHGALQGDNRPFAAISTDTRSLSSGELFFALKGPNFDGHDYIAQAAAQGAAGVVVSELSNVDVSQIVVADTRAALGRLGAAWRQARDVTVVGITGSNGKTTLKELTAACLSAAGPTLATHGNLNNEIGVPLMLSRIEPEHRYAVIEMGANHAGEIAYLTSLASPDIVALTNAGAAHLEGFGSIDGVARAKGEILSGERRPKFAVLNADDHYFDYWASLVEDVDRLSFGLGGDADVYAVQIKAEGGVTSFRLHLPGGEIDLSLALPGTHNVRNACAAAAIATALGIDAETIRTALESVQPVSGRLQPLAGVNGATIFDDTYNANPNSVVAAAEFLATLPGEHWLVLGDMGELGDDAPRLHREVGERVKQAGVSRLFATGGLSRNTVDGFGDDGEWFSSVEALTATLAPALAADISVLVKGSRFMRMERVVDALRRPDTERSET